MPWWSRGHPAPNVVITGRGQVIRIVLFYVAMILIAALLLRSGIVDSNSGAVPAEPCANTQRHASATECLRRSRNLLTRSPYLSKTVQTQQEIM